METVVTASSTDVKESDPDKIFKIVFLILVPLNALVMAVTFGHYFLNDFIWTEEFFKWFGTPKQLHYEYTERAQFFMSFHGISAVLWQAVCHTMVGLMLFGNSRKLTHLHRSIGRKVAPVVLAVFVVSSLIIMFMRPVDEGALATWLTFGSVYVQAFMFFIAVKHVRAGNIRGHKKLMAMVFLFSFQGGLFIRAAFFSSTMLAEAMGGVGYLQMHSLYPDDPGMADSLVVACRTYTVLAVFLLAYLMQGYTRMLRNNILIVAALLIFYYKEFSLFLVL